MTRTRGQVDEQEEHVRGSGRVARTQSQGIKRFGERQEKSSQAHNPNRREWRSWANRSRCTPQQQPYSAKACVCGGKGRGSEISGKVSASPARRCLQLWRQNSKQQQRSRVIENEYLNEEDQAVHRVRPLHTARNTTQIRSCDTGFELQRSRLERAAKDGRSR